MTSISYHKVSHWPIKVGLFTNNKNGDTYSKTELSFWSPHINISAIHLSDSTNVPRLLSDTVVFLQRILCKYFNLSKEWGFLGRPHEAPNQLLLRNMTARVSSTLDQRKQHTFTFFFFSSVMHVVTLHHNHHVLSLCVLISTLLRR